jgi:hypothetical protein
MGFAGGGVNREQLHVKGIRRTKLAKPTSGQSVDVGSLARGVFDYSGHH